MDKNFQCYDPPPQLPSPLDTLHLIDSGASCMADEIYCIRFSSQIKYAEDIGISSHSSSWMYFINGSVSLFCRVIIGKLCDSGRVCFFHIYQCGLVLRALADFLLPQFTQLGYLYAYAVLQGLCEAMYLTPLYCKALLLYPREGLGWLMFFSGIPIFFAPALAGQCSNYIY